MGVVEKIAELKKQKGWTNQDLARESGVPFGTLGKITSGITKNPTLDTLRLIADALGCTLEDFVEPVIGEQPTLHDTQVPVDSNKNEKQNYYINDRVAEIAQEIYDNPEQRILFDASRKLSREDILAVVDIVKRMRSYED